MIHNRAGSYLEELLDKDSSGRDVYSDILYHYAQIGEKLKVLEYTIKLAERYCCPQYELFPEFSGTTYGGNGFVFENRPQIMAYLDKIKELLADLEEEQVSQASLSRFRAPALEMLGRYHIWRGEHLNGLKTIHNLPRLAAKKGFTDYLIKGYQQVVYCAIQIGRPALIEHFANKSAADGSGSKPGRETGRHAPVHGHCFCHAAGNKPGRTVLSPIHCRV